MADRIFEAAIWYNADIEEEKDSAKEGIEESFLRAAVVNGVLFGPIEYDDVDAEYNRLPKPPEGMKGNVRCLIGTAKTAGELPQEQGMTNDLTDEDRKKLRQVTRKAYLAAGGPVLTDEECDQMINEYGPEVVIEEITG